MQSLVGESEVNMYVYNKGLDDASDANDVEQCIISISGDY